MVTTTTLRTCERKHVLVENIFKFVNDGYLNKCLLSEVKWPISLNTRAHLSVLPSDISDMPRGSLWETFEKPKFTETEHERN